MYHHNEQCITDIELSSAGGHIIENIVDIYIHTEELSVFPVFFYTFSFLCKVTAVLCTIHFKSIMMTMILRATTVQEHVSLLFGWFVRSVQHCLQCNINAR